MKIAVLLPGTILLCLVVTVFQTGPIVTAEEEKVQPKDCCYEHPDYQGLCTVTPGEDESCQNILDYLNTPGTANKTYCGGTRIRGGWTLADCPKKDENQPE